MPATRLCLSIECLLRYAADSQVMGGLVDGLNPYLLVGDRQTHIEMRP